MPTLAYDVVPSRGSPFKMNLEPEKPPITALPLGLQYADAPGRYGIVLETTDEGVRISIPKIGISSENIIILASLLATVLSMGAALLMWAGVRGFLLAFAGLSPVVGISLHLAWEFWKFPLSSAKPRSIELKSTALVLINILMEDEKMVVTRPRSQIYDVKYVPHSGNLVVRCHSENMIECRPIADPIVLQWIADVLREALHLP